MAISTNGLQLARIAGAVFNQQLSASDYSEILAANKTAAELDAWANAAVAAEFRNKTTTDIAKAVLANVGLSSVAGLEAWVAGQLTAGGGVAKAGATMLAMLNDFSNMTADATYGAAATTFNQKAANSQALSQTAGTATGTYAAVSTTAAPVVFPLTTGADVKTFGSGNDTINALFATATGMTFQATDSLDGGTGSDTINIQVGATGVHAAASMVGIETVSANFSAAGTVSLLNSTGVTTVESSASSAAATFSNISSVATALKVSNTAQDATFGYTTAAVAGTSDTVALTLSGVTGGTVILAGVETVGITSSGSANTLTGLTATSATTVNVAGDQALALGTLGATVTTLNAGSNTATGTGVSATMGAAATATITGGTGNDSINISAITGDVSIAGGAGNDTVTATTNLTTTDTVGGGDGTADVLSTTATVAESYTAPTTRTITGFERLTLSTAGTAAATLTTANVDTGIATVTLSAGTAGAYGITGPAGTLAVSSATALGGTLTLTDTGTAITDAATLTNSGILAANVFNGAAVTSTGYETLNINSGTGSTITNNAAAQTLGAVTVTVDTGGASAVNFTGGNSLTTGAVAATTISASGMTGTAALTLGSATGATSITGSANNDTIGASTVASSVTGGAGNDTITGGALNDTINGGDGADQINGGVGKDSLTGGAGVDTFVFTAPTALLVTSSTAAPDVITDFVSGTDKLTTPAVAFTGVFTNYTAGVAATQLTGLANQAFFVSGENNLYVLTTANTTTAATDLVVNLPGVTTLTAADLNIGSMTGGNTITLSTASAVVNATTSTNANTVSTALNDAINSSIANLTGTTIDGLTGIDTLTLTTAGAVGTIANTVQNVETLVLATDSTTANTGVALASTTDFSGITGSSNADTVTVTNLVAGGVVNLGGGVDNIAGMTEAIVEGVGSTFVGGTSTSTTTGNADIDVLTFAAGITTANLDLSRVSGFETIDLGTVTTGGVTITAAQFATGVTTLAGNTTTAAITANLTAAQLDALTTVTVGNGTNAFNIVVNNTGAYTVTLSDLAVTNAFLDNISFAASSGATVNLGAEGTGLSIGKAAAANALTFGSGADTLNINGVVASAGGRLYDLGGGADIVNVNIADGIVTATDLDTTASTTSVLNVNANVSGATLTLATNMDIFGTVNFTVDQVSGGNMITINNGATRVTAVGGDFTLGTGGDIFTATAGTNLVTGGTGADSITGGTGADTIGSRASGANTPAADILTGGAGIDTFILRGDVTGAGATLAAYGTVPRVTDFVVGTDILALSVTTANYGNGHATLTGLNTGVAAAAAGSTAIQDLGSASAGTAYTAGGDLIKLTAAVATTTNMTIQQAFIAAIGTSTITGLGAGTEIFVSFYDSTNSRMVVLLADPVGAGTNTVLEGIATDTVSLIGTIDMTAANYALFSAASLSLIAA